MNQACPNQWEQTIRNSESKRNQDGTIGYKSEDKMLSEFMIWARNTYPKLRKTLFHIENEGVRGGEHGAEDGARSLAKGKLSGVPDVCCVLPSHPCFIEFKLPKGVYSPKQKELIDYWKEIGVVVYECRNFKDWQAIVEDKILGIL